MRITFENDTINLYGYVYESDASSFAAALAAVDGKYPVVKINLHSLGGSVFGGNLIYNSLLSAKSEVHIRVVGVAASMGFIIMMAGGRIEMVENGFCMSHEASGWTSGTAKDHEAHAKLLRGINQSFLRKLMNKTGKSKSEAKKWLEGDNWFDAEEALELGFIDAIIDPLGTLEISDPEGMDKNELAAAFEAVLINELPKEKGGNENTDEMDRNSLLAQLGIEVAADASDTEVIEAVKAEFDKLKGKADTDGKALQAMKDKVEELKASSVERLLAQGRSAGVVNKTNEEHYKKVGLESGIDVLEGILSGTPARKPISDSLNQPSPLNARAGWDWDKYQAEAAADLERMKEEDLDSFKALFKAKYGVDYEE